MSTTEMVRHELKKIGIKESAYNLLNAGFSWDKIKDLLKLPMNDMEEFKEEYRDRQAIKSMLQEGKTHEEIEKALNVEDYLIDDVLEKMQEK